MAGWNDQWLAELRLPPESWTAPLEVERVPPTGNANQVAITQVQRLLHARGASGRPKATAAAATTATRSAPAPLVVWDAGYDATQLGVGLAAELAARRRFG